MFGGPFFMPLYDKPPLTYLDQLALLRDRGLRIDRSREAEHVLRMVGYARLSSYWHPLLQSTDPPRFRAGASFSEAYVRYQVDSELRRVTLYAVDHVEIALRARLAYEVSHDRGTGLWLVNPSLFNRFGNQLQLAARIIDSFSRSQDAFATEYVTKYSADAPVPPAWLAFEMLTIDNVVAILSNLKDRNLRNALSDDYDLDQDTFISWLKAIAQVRNFAAHHARLWNRALVKEPQWPKRFRERTDWVVPWADHGSKPGFYAVLCCMAWLLDRINPRNSFRARLNVALGLAQEVAPEVEREMGCPADWREQPLWRRGSRP